MVKGRLQLKVGISILLILSLIALWGCQKPHRLVQVSETSGDVQIKRVKQETAFAAVSGMNLNNQDIVNTAVKSFATLNIDNEQTVSIWENVKLEIAELLSKSKELKTTKLNLLDGKVYIRIQKALNPGESFEITTPNCVMGVRGTQFFVSTYHQKTEIAVLHGSVQIALPSEPEKTMIIQVNQRIVIDEKVKTILDIIPIPLIQSELDLMVLKEIQAEPEGIAPFLLDGVDEEIQRKENETNLSLLGVLFGQETDRFATSFVFENAEAMKADGWAIDNEKAVTFSEQGGILLKGDSESVSVSLVEGIPANVKEWRIGVKGMWLGGVGHSGLNVQVDTKRHTYSYTLDGTTSEYSLFRDGEKIVGVGGYTETANQLEYFEIEMKGSILSIYSKGDLIATYQEKQPSPVTVVSLSTPPNTAAIYTWADAFVPVTINTK